MCFFFPTSGQEGFFFHPFFSTPAFSTCFSLPSLCVLTHSYYPSIVTWMIPFLLVCRCQPAALPLPQFFFPSNFCSSSHQSHQSLHITLRPLRHFPRIPHRPARTAHGERTTNNITFLKIFLTEQCKGSLARWLKDVGSLLPLIVKFNSLCLSVHASY